jgi:hypothetical protein
VPSELLDRVRDVLTEDPAHAVMNGSANWRPGFGYVIPIQNVRSIVAHQTAGWPPRSQSHEFVRRYTIQRIGDNINPPPNEVIPCANCPPPPPPAGAHSPSPAQAGCHCKWGIGPMYFISYDGTIARLISNAHNEALKTNHATWVNDRAIGVETGNLFTTAPPSAPRSRWIRVSQTPATEDQPGANLFVQDMRGNPREVIACWWTTANYAGPAREKVGAGRMLFSEAQYQSWALLARFLAEQFGVPRNLPLLPWAARGDNVNVADSYRRIVLADPAFDAIVADLPAAWHMPAATFEHNPNALRNAYLARVVGFQNEAWLRLFNHPPGHPQDGGVFSGFHGHALTGYFNGTNMHEHPSDHDCPGPLFDWHRFARELWDWWWCPFDVQDVPPANTTTTAVPTRGYRKPDRATPLIEHYFDDDNHDPAVGALDARHAARRRDSIEGEDSSGTTWRLDPGSPVYAMANGELVAARFVQPADVVSMSFLLVRHLIFHQTVGGPDPIAALRLDYDHPPSTVYSLYMHIGHPQGLDLTAVNAANPDWLNRVHIRKKECDLGMDFYNPPAGQHHGIPDAAWNQPLPGQLARPTLVDSWRIDQRTLDSFLADLAAGRIAIAPFTTQSTPIRIILGDYLGAEGAVAKQGAGTVRGIRVEAFSPQALPGLTIMLNQYQSEWSLDLNKTGKAYRDHLRAVGVDLKLVTWWPTVAKAMIDDKRIIAADRLPEDGRVFHLEVFKFMRWINGITWKSEWPKYQLQDAAGHRLPAPPQPRSRRW